MKQLLGNLYQVGGEAFTYELDGASYLVTDGHESHVLIDCGSREGYPALKRRLGQLGLDIGDIDYVLATHCHRDHISAMADIEQETRQTKLYIHRRDLRAAKEGDSDRTAAYIYHREAPKIDTLRALPHNFQLKIGHAVIDAIHTPGHTPGSVTYSVAQPEGKVLIAGDTLWGGFHQRIRSNAAEWEKSLQVLAEERAEYVTFGHGVDKLVDNADNQHLSLAAEQFGFFYNPWRQPNPSPPQTVHERAIAS